jgi:hypothetical protein
LLKPGQHLVVTDSAGRDIDGKYVDIVGDDLVLRQPGARRIPVRVITRVRRADSIWDGAVLGGVIAGGLCLFVCGPGLDRRNQLLPVVLANGGAGALFGLGADALTKPAILYQQPLQPRGGLDNRGPLVTVRLRF